MTNHALSNVGRHANNKKNSIEEAVMKNEKVGNESGANKWQLGTGWFVGDIRELYRPNPIAAFPGTEERLKKLAPGIVIPDSPAALLKMIQDGVDARRKEEASDVSTETE